MYVCFGVCGEGDNRQNDYPIGGWWLDPGTMVGVTVEPGLEQHGKTGFY